MPKNKLGGKKHKRTKNFNNNIKRELVFKEDGQEYAKVTKMLGTGHVDLDCFDGECRIGHIRGKMRKKVWISVGDIVLIGLRDYEPKKGDIMFKYNAEETRNLIAYGEIPNDININEHNEEEFEIEFAQEGEYLSE